MTEKKRSPDLAALQRRLWQLITAPEGAASVLRATQTAGDSDWKLADWIVSDTQLSALQRVEVYANAYFYRILDCLKEDYAALAIAVGDAGFHDLVTAYLLAHPSRHPSLRHVGALLEEFLARSPRAAPFRRRWPWAADLARLEWALVNSFDAPDASALTREELARVPPEKWETLELRLHDSVQVLHLDWPVHELREVLERESKATRLAHPSAAAAADLHALVTRPGENTLTPPDAPKPSSVCVWRKAERVFWRPVDSLEAELLTAARAGASFGALCQRTSEALGANAAPAYAAARFQRWVADALLVPCQL